MRLRLIAFCCLLMICLAVSGCYQFNQPRLDTPPIEPKYTPAPPGATVDRLLVLNTGITHSNEAHFFAGGDEKKPMTIPIPAFLIEHRGQFTLVDTGLAPALSRKMSDYVGLWLTPLVKIQMKATELNPEWDVPARLKKLGIDKAAVNRVILTHAHFDHTGANRDFLQATFFLSPRLLRAARHGFITQGYWSDDFPSTMKVEPVDFSGTPPFLTFAGSIDLFGDGAVVLLPMPGHDIDCQGVFVRTKDGPVLLAGDAVYTLRNIRETILNGFLVDPPQAWNTLHRFKRLMESAPEIRIVPSHDMEALKTISKDR